MTRVRFGWSAIALVLLALAGFAGLFAWALWAPPPEVPAVVAVPMAAPEPEPVVLRPPPPPPGGAVFRYAEDLRPKSLLPFFAEDMASVRLVELIFDGLVVVGRRGDLEPRLATSWKADTDRRGIRFQLRQGVKWHDGHPFTARDVVFTITAAQDPGTIFNAKSRFGFIRTVEAKGDHEVHVRFEREVANAERRFLFKIMPAHLFGGPAISRKDPFARNPVGTGPYRLAAPMKAREVNLEANTVYWEPVHIPRMAMYHIPDKFAQVTLLQYRGEKAGVDAVVFLPPKTLPNFENSETVILEPYHTVSWWYLAFNHARPGLSDPAVRRAMLMATDRQELLETHLGRGDLLSGPFTESSPFYDFTVQPPPVDSARAMSVLQEAGWRRADETWEKDGTRLDLELVLDKELPNGLDLAKDLQAMCARAGINLRLRFLDHAAYRREIFDDEHFDLTINIWSFEEVEEVYPLFHSRGVMNFMHYANPDVDAILDEARKTRDYAEYKKHMKRLHAAVAEDLPYLFLWTWDIYSGLDKRVRHVDLAPYYYFSSAASWDLKAPSR